MHVHVLGTHQAAGARAAVLYHVFAYRIEVEHRIKSGYLIHFDRLDVEQIGDVIHHFAAQPAPLFLRHVQHRQQGRLLSSFGVIGDHFVHALLPLRRKGNGFGYLVHYSMMTGSPVR